jgi:hypothetical protein
MGWFLAVWALYAVVSAAVGWEASLRHKAAEAAETPGDEAPAEPTLLPPWALRALVAVALGVFLLRAPLAAAREIRNVDESHYMAITAFVTSTGESLFAHPGGPLRGHTLVYFLGSFAAVDVVTSLVVALTGFLLGLALLRSPRPSLPAALLTPALYGLGLMHFEGLTSNAEPYANLFLAAWILLRLDPARSAPSHRVIGGVLLGAAAVMKEQTIPLLLLEPVIEALALHSGRSAGWRESAKGLALAAVGYWIPLGVFLAAFATQGELGLFLQQVLGWAGDAGNPNQVAAAEDVSVGLTLFLGNASLAFSPIGFLGGAFGLRLLFEARRASTAEHLLPVGLLAGALLALGCVSVGMRWFSHYFMLTLPFLAPLAALRVAEFPASWRASGGQRAVAVGLVAVALVLTALEVSAALRRPEIPRGSSMTPTDREDAEEIARAVKALVPDGEPILVWGWRPELYHLANRPPATRYRANWLLRVEPARVLADLERWPPRAIVVPGPRGLGDAAAFSLEQHQWLLEYVRDKGFEMGPRQRGYVVVFRR